MYGILIALVCLYVFGKLSACWVLVMLMARFLLTNDVFDLFIYFVVIFCSIRLFIIFYCKYY